ncbi:hypothetical protein DSO57_1014505 [Entomophthora muscae]|uniref:Uncharacterized protein n=1 Tax=Entomophthora muscae TaxID=34485 RepID=A0ACC2SIG5_9FUNG|nr:hypothetical protein DSO57_1014505 [Entomophthora muscae]
MLQASLPLPDSFTTSSGWKQLSPTPFVDGLYGLAIQELLEVLWNWDGSLDICLYPSYTSNSPIRGIFLQPQDRTHPGYCKICAALVS